MSRKDKKITENTVLNRIVPQDKMRKPPYVEASFMEQIKKHNESGSKKPIKTKSRRSTITPNIIGKTIEIYNGKTYKSCLITEDMVGYKLGEFAPTRTFKAHSGDKKK